MAIWDMVTKPIRGVSRALRAAVGKGPGFRAAIQDIGSGAQAAAPLLALTGVGAPLAIGIGAAGGALERGARRGFNIENIARGGVTGGGRAAAAQALKGVAGRLSGAPGGPAQPNIAQVGRMESVAQGAQIPQAVTQQAAGGGGWLRGMAGGAKDLWSSLDPETRAYLIAQGLATPMELYGAKRAGDIAERQAELEEQRYRDPLEARRAMAPLIAEYLKYRMPNWRSQTV